MEGVRHVSNTIAHEMRTPMARILAALRSADRPGATDRQVRLANRAAVRELEALTAVFDKLLQIAEAESGTRRQAFRQTEIDQIMRDVIDLFTAVADEQGSSLVDRTGRHLTVLGDRDLLAGAISNLVENALKYTRPGARIRVGADREGDAVVLTVRDNGPGVPAPSFKQLGTRFYRLDRSLPGFGLGLASVLAVAQAARRQRGVLGRGARAFRADPPAGVATMRCAYGSAGCSAAGRSAARPATTLPNVNDQRRGAGPGAHYDSFSWISRARLRVSDGSCAERGQGTRCRGSE